MELIIIGALTTIALMAMQAAEFLQGRHRFTASRMPAAATAAATGLATPAAAPRLHVEEESLERAA